MKTSVMDVIEITQHEFRTALPRLLREKPGFEVRIVENGKVAARFMLPKPGRPKGCPEGVKLIGDGPTSSEYVSAQRD